MDKQKLKLEAMIKKLSDEGKIDLNLFEYRDYPIPPKSQYFGKIFIKTLLKKDKIEEARRTKKHVIVGFHIRPYKIGLNEVVTLQSEPSSPFKNSNSAIRIDYDRGTGNFHKLPYGKEKMEFQVVLVAANGGKEKYTPDLPDFAGRIWEKDEDSKDKYLKKEFKEAVDRVGMYFPKLSEPAENDLYDVLKRAAKAAKINLI